MSLVASISLEIGNKEQKTFLLPAVEQLGEQTHQEFSETSQVTKKEHIKNVVLLVLENRSFDNLFGAFVNEEDPVDNLLDKQFCNPVSTEKNLTLICSSKIEPDAVINDPSHSIAGTNFGLFQKYRPDENLVRNGSLKANMNGFIEIQSRTHKIADPLKAAPVLNYYMEEHVPVLSHLAKEYVLFDKWFAAVPGPTNPNRAYITSGSSNGIGNNAANWDFGGQSQTSIFEQLTLHNISWINYSNSSGTKEGFFEPGTPVAPANPSLHFNPDAAFFEWTWKSGMTKNIKGIDHFFSHAKEGTLPSFSYINPECCSYHSMHPPSPIHMGEEFLKSIYDTLRASPQWDSTLFIVTFDEAGGFADHVVPPVNVPSGISPEKIWIEKTPEGNTLFDFSRLGLRVPTILISPFVGKGVVEHEQFTHTSILATLSKMWNLGSPFGSRVDYSPTFDHLFLNQSRETPLELNSPNYLY